MALSQPVCNTFNLFPHLEVFYNVFLGYMVKIRNSEKIVTPSLLNIARFLYLIYNVQFLSFKANNPQGKSSKSSKEKSDQTILRVCRYV